ncbi:hypothetical protein VPH35_072692 [Triticum aestivum]
MPCCAAWQPLPHALPAPSHRLHRHAHLCQDRASMPPHLPGWSGRLLVEASRGIERPRLLPLLLAGSLLSLLPRLR